MRLERVADAENVSVSAAALKVGELAIAIGADHVVLRTYNGVVSLTNPTYTWSLDTPLQVKKLPTGTTFTITQE